MFHIFLNLLKLQSNVRSYFAYLQCHVYPCSVILKLICSVSWNIPLNDVKALADNQMLESLPPDSDEQQAHITAIQNEDGYNWG